MARSSSGAAENSLREGPSLEFIFNGQNCAESSSCSRSRPVALYSRTTRTRSRVVVVVVV
ncbi:hypothetical protein V9T40_010557 [Parthenolecanium corni]|uniref:Uncharacterized protein n=1 Tax=Parthenolecanium corni TaxID=536013 RepID=A0AAN9T5F4_9HEMI